MLKKINDKSMKATTRILAAVMTASVSIAGAGSTIYVSAQDNNIQNYETEIIAEEMTSSGGILETGDIFTDRDLNQTVDLTGAKTITVMDDEDIHITEEGIYVINGEASNMTIYVEAADNAKVQLVLDGVTITNTEKPCIYVASADKVFLTTSSDSQLAVSETFAPDTENADAAVFSCEDLVLNGTAQLTISSSDTGIDTKDDLKITGGTYKITAKAKAFEANDSICIADGYFYLEAGTDGLHAENHDDDTKGFVYIADGTFEIKSGDDGIHGTSIVQIDGGSLTIDAVEGIEGTYIQINGGELDINASDDGINAARKSDSYDVTLEITGGNINIEMAQGDTDALDANGNLIISGGELNITAMSAFDYDGTGTYTGGTLIVNGEQVTELTQSMMGPGGGMEQEGMFPDGNRKEGEMPTPPDENMKGRKPGDESGFKGGRPGDEHEMEKESDVQNDEA